MLEESIDSDNNLCEEEDEKPEIMLDNELTEESMPEEDSDYRDLDVGHKIPYIKWHDSINKNLRLLIKSEIQQENFKRFLISYLSSLKENLPYLLPYPKRCRCVAKKITRILFLFRSLCSNTTEIDLYNAKMCELLSILTTLELKYASNFDEPKIGIANRLCMNYDIHLKNLDVSHILRVFLYLNRNLLFDQTEVLTKIFEKYLKKFKNCTQIKLNDKLYCMYLVAYHLWVYIETDIYEKTNIKTYANKVIAPRESLRSNARYAPFLPEYPPDELNITKFILDKGFNRVKLVKALIADDVYEDVVINLCDEECQEQIIDLDIDTPDKSFENLHITSVVKHETPELVATIDLTEEKEDEHKNSPWLNKLIKLARQARENIRNPPDNPSNIEIIDLDDSDIDFDDEEEEENNSTGVTNEKDYVEKQHETNLNNETENNKLQDKADKDSSDEIVECQVTNFDSLTEKIVNEKSTNSENVTIITSQVENFEKSANEVNKQKSQVLNEPSSLENEITKTDKNTDTHNEKNQINLEISSLLQQNNSSMISNENQNATVICTNNINSLPNNNSISTIFQTPSNIIHENEKISDAKSSSDNENIELDKESMLTGENKDKRNEIGTIIIDNTSIDKRRENNRKKIGDSIAIVKDHDESTKNKENQTTDTHILPIEEPIISTEKLSDNYIGTDKVIQVKQKNKTENSSNIAGCEEIKNTDKQVNNDLIQIHESESSITTSSTSKSPDVAESEFIPIFDEDMSFVINYAAKTYCKKKVEEIKDDHVNTNKEFETVIKINDKMENNDKSKRHQNSVHHEIISSTTSLPENYVSVNSPSINDKNESGIQNEKKKNDSEKILHRFFAPKKVNFAPLPEKHTANPENPAKKNIFEKRFRKGISSDRIQTSFIPPAGTEAYKIYESQRDVSSDITIITNKPKPKISSPTVGPIIRPVDISEMRLKAIPTVSNNTTLASRPTASSILAVTGVKPRGNGNVTGMNDLNSVDSELNTQDNKHSNNEVSDTLSKTSTDISVEFNNFNLDPDSTVGDDSIVLGCESDNNLSSNNVNFNITSNTKHEKHNVNSTYIERCGVSENDVKHKLSGNVAIFPQKRKSNNFDDTDNSEEDDEESNLTNPEYVEKQNMLPMIQESNYPEDLERLRHLFINRRCDDSSCNSMANNINTLCFNKQVEVQTSLPLKKRRKISIYNERFPIKEEVHYLGFPRFNADMDEMNDKVVQQQQQQAQPTTNSFLDGISYPSTPMLSIANFENLICFTHHTNQQQSMQPQQLMQPNSLQFKANNNNQFKDMGGQAVNLQTINILPPRAAILENSNNRTNTLTYNILPSQTQTVVSNNKNQTNIQTFNIIPTIPTNENSSSNNIPIPTTTELTSKNIQTNPRNLFSTSSTDLNNFNVSVYKEALPSVQTVNVMPNTTFQHTLAFHRHPTQPFTSYNLQQQQQPQSQTCHPNGISSTSNNICHLTDFQANNRNLCHSGVLPPKLSGSYQNFRTDNSPSNHQSLDIDINNYNLNRQHVDNYFYNSQINWLAKQNIFNEFNSSVYKRQQQQQQEQEQQHQDREREEYIQSRNDDQEQQHQNFLRQHLQEQFQILNLKQNQTNQLSDLRTPSSLSSSSSSTTSATSTNQQKTILRPSGKPQAFLEFMNNLTSPKRTVSSENINKSPSNQTTLSGYNNKFNESPQLSQQNFILDPTFLQTSNNEIEQICNVTGNRKRKSKACAEERITRASNRIAKNKAHDAQKKSSSSSSSISRR